MWVEEPLLWCVSQSAHQGRGTMMKGKAKDKGRVSKARETYAANTGACSCTLNPLMTAPPSTAFTVATSSDQRRSHIFTCPSLHPDTSSLSPPRCMCTLVIHCLCFFQSICIAFCGLTRWSKTRRAPSPYPATRMLPATASVVREVRGEDERAPISYWGVSGLEMGVLMYELGHGEG